MPAENKNAFFPQITQTLGAIGTRPQGYYTVGDLIYRPTEQGRPSVFRLGEQNYYIQPNGIFIIDEAGEEAGEIEDYQLLHQQIIQRTNQQQARFIGDDEAPNPSPQIPEGLALFTSLIRRLEENAIREAQQHLRGVNLLEIMAGRQQIENNNHDRPSPSPRGVSEVYGIRVNELGQVTGASLVHHQNREVTQALSSSRNQQQHF